MSEKWILFEVQDGEWKDPEYFLYGFAARKRFSERSVGAYHLYLVKIIEEKGV